MLTQHSNTEGSRHLTQLSEQSRNIALVVNDIMKSNKSGDGMEGTNVYAMQLFRLHVMIYTPFLLILHYYYFTKQCLYQTRGGEVHVSSRASEDPCIFV